MMNDYQPQEHLKWLENIGNYTITESQFAHFIGKCKMSMHYEATPELALTDSQIGSVVKGYCSDPNFSQDNGQINLWNLYNLLTEANKSSYIDGFLDRGVNSGQIVDELICGIKRGSWYLP